MSEFGRDEGSVCGREGCDGVIEFFDSEGCCSCHIVAPCSFCESEDLWCAECGWRLIEEEISICDKSSKPLRESSSSLNNKRQSLDPTKIDWQITSYSSLSMTKEGVYPEGTSIQDVEKAVSGTFGGRFDSFGNGRFKYIAYTD